MIRPQYFKRVCKLVSLLLVFGVHSVLAGVSPLQLFVDLTPEGQTLRPIPGTYKGSISIRKAIILDGAGEVTLDGDSSGTVVTILADGVIVRNLNIVNSGGSHDQMDSGIKIEADGAVVEHNQLENVLFGIVIQSGVENHVHHNNISSIDGHLTLKGEGIRLWNSVSNYIENNRIVSARDVVFANSPNNYFVNNEIIDGRIGIELIFSPSCEIEGNLFHHNEHGMIGIYSDSVIIRNNRFQHQNKLMGSAMAVKGSSQVLFEGNEILDCAIGLTANAPIFPENTISLIGNTFAYNDVAIYFYGDRGGHTLHDNVFKGNFQQVVVTHPDGAVHNDWLGNYWDNYTGFDLNGDGIGDTPYSSYLYSERLWMDRDMARFFRGTPMLEMIDLAERLAPFSRPPLVLRDKKPRMSPDF